MFVLLSFFHSIVMKALLFYIVYVFSWFISIYIIWHLILTNSNKESVGKGCSRPTPQCSVNVFFLLLTYLYSNLINQFTDSKNLEVLGTNIFQKHWIQQIQFISKLVSENNRFCFLKHTFWSELCRVEYRNWNHIKWYKLS